jgi:hypothetical protein
MLLPLELEMTNQHPIQPSPELVEQCMEMFRSGTRMEAMCEVAAQWGADEELHAICAWLDHGHTGYLIDPLLCTRRPKPPSLKEQALAVLDDYSDLFDGAHQNIIRRALEALPQ